MTALSIDPWGKIVAIAIGVVIAALIAHRLLRPVVLHLSRFSAPLRAVARQCDRPLRLLLPLIALQLVWQGVPDDVPGLSAVEHAGSVLTIAALTWLVARAVRAWPKG